jgi:hypothetical protein
VATAVLVVVGQGHQWAETFMIRRPIPSKPAAQAATRLLAAVLEGEVEARCE